MSTKGTATTEHTNKASCSCLAEHSGVQVALGAGSGSDDLFDGEDVPRHGDKAQDSRLHVFVRLPRDELVGPVCCAAAVLCLFLPLREPLENLHQPLELIAVCPHDVPLRLVQSLLDVDWVAAVDP